MHFFLFEVKRRISLNGKRFLNALKVLRSTHSDQCELIFISIEYVINKYAKKMKYIMMRCSSKVDVTTRDTSVNQLKSLTKTTKSGI